VEEGKIRFWGVSAASLADAAPCLDVPGLATLQVVFNALEPEAADTLLPQAVARGLAVIARVPLARGLLTPDMAVKTGSAHSERTERRAERHTVESVAAAVRAGERSLLQAALQFVLHHSQVSVTIPGTRTVAHLEEILATSEAPPLGAAEIREMRRLAGART
jgi:aryl-alcohol dehydrogenase-like predicted oxidoreductase